VRRDFDLCASCYNATEHEHPFIKIRDPAQAPRFFILVVLPPLESIDTSLDAFMCHNGVQCNQCGEAPIIGKRFKCLTRRNYDLCEKCFDEDTTGLPMLEIVRPSQAPAQIRCFDRRHHHDHRKETRHLRKENRQRWREYMNRCKDISRTSMEEANGLSQSPAAAPVVEVRRPDKNHSTGSSPCHPGWSVRVQCGSSPHRSLSCPGGRRGCGRLGAAAYPGRGLLAGGFRGGGG
jgi:hypothetical protein